MADCNHTQQAKHLMLIAQQLRRDGDPNLLWLEDSGVTNAGMTLADELTVIALNVNWDAAMEVIDP